MGTFRADVEIGDPAGRRWERVDALVDTGATYTSLPRLLLDALGVVPHARDTFLLADGRTVERDIGRTWIRIAGHAEMTLVVFADGVSPPLLGAYALEGLRLAADPVGKRLVPVPGLLLSAIPGSKLGTGLAWPNEYCRRPTSRTSPKARPRRPG